MKELEKLPDSLPHLYDLLVTESRKGRTNEELASLKRLFAWLAFSKRSLTLGEASNLVTIVGPDTNLSIEEEIDGGLSRYIRSSSSGEKVDC